MIATHALAKLNDLESWSAAVLSSPFYSIKVKEMENLFGAKLSRLVPTLGATDLNPSHMSHDSIVDAYSMDPLMVESLHVGLQNIKCT